MGKWFKERDFVPEADKTTSFLEEQGGLGFVNSVKDDDIYNNIYNINNNYYYDVPISKIQSLYNEICKNFSPVLNITENRKVNIAKSWELYPSLKSFEEAFTKVSKNRFFCGDNSYKWTASFDWIIKDDNMTRILEGFYDRKQSLLREHVSYDIEEYERESIFDEGVDKLYV